MITHSYQLPPCMVGYLIKEVHTLCSAYIPTAIVFVRGIHPKSEFYTKDKGKVYWSYIWNDLYQAYIGITLFENEFVLFPE